MSYYTILHKQIVCPFWGCQLTLEGKYRYSEEEGHEHEAKFSFAECPIIRNNRLPERKRDKSLSCYAYCKIYPCEALDDFEPTISE